MAEADIMREIMVKASELTHRLFRNNVGQAWAGQQVRVSKPSMVMVRPGDIILRNAMPINFGLCKGSSDTIGWRSIEITPEMVGKRFAQFAACEVKDKGHPTNEQRAFMTAVQVAGGWAEVARSAEEYAEKISK